MKPTKYINKQKNELKKEFVAKFFLGFFFVCFYFVGGGDNQYPYVSKSATHFCIYTHLVQSTGDLQVTWEIKKTKLL
jgi:hypothetical protein